MVSLCSTPLTNLRNDQCWLLRKTTCSSISSWRLDRRRHTSGSVRFFISAPSSSTSRPRISFAFPACAGQLGWTIHGAAHWMSFSLSSPMSSLVPWAAAETPKLRRNLQHHVFQLLTNALLHRSHSLFVCPTSPRLQRFPMSVCRSAYTCRPHRTCRLLHWLGRRVIPANGPY